MDLHQKVHSLKYLGSISDDSTQLGTKITLLSLPSTKRLQLTEAILLILEYLQLISQTLLLYPDLYQDDNLSNQPFFNGVIYGAKLLSPGYLINFQTENKACFVVVALLAFFTFCKFALYAYTVLILLRGKTGSNFLINTWKCLFQSQAGVIYYLASSFWLNAILAAYDNKFEVFGKTSKSSTVAFCSTFAILEILFSFFLMIAHCCLLPTKNWLSSKDVKVQVITLSQKFLIQLIQIFSQINSLSADWVLIIINLLFSAQRTIHFFRNFPLYNLRALFLKAGLIACVSAFHIASLIQRIVESGGQLEGDFRLLLLLGIILSFISVIVVINYMKNMIFELVTSNKHKSPKLIVFKLNAIKYLRTLCKTPSSFTEKYDYSYLLSAAISSRAKKIFSLESNNNLFNLDTENKETMNLIFANLLEEILIKYPKSLWIKLYAAYFYATKLRFYGKAMKLIGEIRQKRNFIINFNTSLILNQVQKSREIEFGNNEDTLNLHLYMSSLSQLAKLKLRMIQQADFQTKLHQEMIEESPDLAKLFNTGQEIDACKQKIEAGVKRMLHTIPDYFITPYILLAHYEYELNHNPEAYKNLMKIYYSKRAKHDKFWKTNDLIQQTLYQPNTSLVAVSSQKPDVGKIYYSNKATWDMCGGDAKYYLGKQIYDMIALPSLRFFYAAFFRSMADTGDKALLGKSIREIIIHADGHAIEVDYYMNFQPFMTQGSFLNLIMREIFSNKEYILILENGDIEISSKKIGERLGLHKSRKTASKGLHNIKQISEELGRLNEAYNIIAFPEKYDKLLPGKNSTSQAEITPCPSPQFNSEKLGSAQLLKNKTMPLTMDKAEAEVLYNLYTSEGNALSLLSLKTELGGSYVGGAGSFQISNDTYKYHCRMYNMPYGTFLLKKIELIEIKEGTKEKLETKGAFSNHNEKPLINYNLISPRGRETEDDDEFGFSEKKQGWIDFKGLQSNDIGNRRDSERTNLISPRLEMQPTKEDCPLSPMSSRNLLTTPAGGGLFEEQSQSPKLPHAKNTPKSKTTETTNQAQNAKLLLNDHGPTESIADSQISTKSNNNKYSRAYKKAVNSKYYSKSFRILAFIFYTVLVSIFACQIGLNYVLADTKGSLKTKKEILLNAQLRTYYLSNIQAAFRQIWDIGTGRTTLSELGAAGKPVPVYIASVAGFIPYLIATNSALLKNVDSLSDDIRKNLFEKDVRVYNVDTDPSGEDYSNMTAFQGTERIIETTIKGLALARVNVNTSVDEYNFILRNALNDIFLKNDEISAIFLESALSQISSIKNKVTGFAIGIVILMVSISFILFYITLRQYMREVKNMNAFVRLNTADIRQIMVQIKSFKADLEEEGSFEDVDKDKLHEVRRCLRAGLNIKPQLLTKEYSKTAHSSGIARKYWLYAGKWLVLLAIFIGLSTYNFKYNYNSLNNLRTKQVQLDFVNHMNTRINIAMCTAQELPIGNGTTLIKNVNTSQGIFDVIADLKLLQTQVNEYILQSDLMENSQVKQIIFDDGCEYYDPSIQYYCKVLSNKGVQNSFVELLVLLENFVIIREQQYFASNKTVAALKAIQLQNYDYLVSVKRVLSGGSTVISSIIDADFENYIEETKAKEKMFNNYFYILGVVVLVLTWILIFNQLDESENQFKKVIKTLPARIVLSSFLLKCYLMKSSQGLLNSVKRDT